MTSRLFHGLPYVFAVYFERCTRRLAERPACQARPGDRADDPSGRNRNDAGLLLASAHERHDGAVNLPTERSSCIHDSGAWLALTETPGLGSDWPVLGAGRVVVKAGTARCWRARRPSRCHRSWKPAARGTDHWTDRGMLWHLAPLACQGQRPKAAELPVGPRAACHTRDGADHRTWACCGCFPFHSLYIVCPLAATGRQHPDRTASMVIREGCGGGIA